MHQKNIIHHIFRFYYGDFSATIKIEDCEIADGKLPTKQVRLVAAWIEIHREELMADWFYARMEKDLFLLNL